MCQYRDKHKLKYNSCIFWYIVLYNSIYRQSIAYTISELNTVAGVALILKVHRQVKLESSYLCVPALKQFVYGPGIISASVRDGGSILYFFPTLFFIFILYESSRSTWRNGFHLSISLLLLFFFNILFIRLSPENLKNHRNRWYFISSSLRNGSFSKEVRDFRSTSYECRTRGVVERNGGMRDHICGCIAVMSRVPRLARAQRERAREKERKEKFKTSRRVGRTGVISVLDNLERLAACVSPYRTYLGTTAYVREQHARKQGAYAIYVRYTHANAYVTSCGRKRKSAPLIASRY